MLLRSAIIATALLGSSLAMAAEPVATSAIVPVKALKARGRSTWASRQSPTVASHRRRHRRHVSFVHRAAICAGPGRCAQLEIPRAPRPSPRARRCRLVVLKSAKSLKPTKPFERVWAIVKKVPKGRVVTYGTISEMIDKRLTPVGVGWAIRAAGDDVPWQRVVNSSGGISTDKQHPGLQRAMLEAEGVKFRSDGTLDLAKYAWQSKPRR